MSDKPLERVVTGVLGDSVLEQDVNQVIKEGYVVKDVHMSEGNQPFVFVVLKVAPGPAGNIR